MLITMITFVTREYTFYVKPAGLFGDFVLAP